MRAIKVKLDENLGKTHAEFLRQAGYHAERIHDQGLSGWSDEEVWKKFAKSSGFLSHLIRTLRISENIR